MKYGVPSKAFLGASGDFDFFRPQHLKDMLGNLRDDPSNHLYTALADLVSLTHKGRVPVEVCLYTYGAKLIA